MAQNGTASKLPMRKRRSIEAGAEAFVLGLAALLTVLLVVPAGWLDDLRGRKRDTFWP